MGKPQPGDYVPFHETYISKVGEGSILTILQNQQQQTYQFFKSLTTERAAYAYAEGKWTIKQTLGHMIDTERIMAYRALRFARNDDTPLPGFDQDEYVLNSRHNDFEMDDMIEEFRLTRQANIFFCKTLNAEEKQRFGLASGNRVTVNALLYIIAGHELHHIQIIKERYL
ncbi:DinB family protein [Mucilaginibacter gracilis]|uniref:DinB family protein n=1 Tax=Mucilaginibacter gracilis TaxID=423350 RepID=A0A495IZU1_9SPHI|nr:DinB family protein [Mucilaginibacter gracilis]RKR81349.1 DinB family protein [Mucilaginibacter gracilis]